MDQATVRDYRATWAIVLAAGASSRLGTPKQLLRKQGVTLLGRTLALARTVVGDNVIVVLGAQRLRMQSYLRRSGSKAQIVFNKSWRNGMGSSLSAGIRALAPQAEAALVLLSDQPNIRTRSLRRLLIAHRSNRAAITASRYAGRLGVPAIFPRSTFAVLGSLNGDQGARVLLNSDSQIRIIAVDMPEAVLDIDTPADAAALSGGNSASASV